MGGISSSRSSFEEHNWRNIESKNGKCILYNDMTMKSVEKHQAILDYDEGEVISMCKWRENLPQNCGVVDLYQFGILSSGICNSHSQLYVITERLHLLSEIGSFSKPEAFIILRDVAMGLRILFRKFGHFNPSPNTIGINHQGKAKVWSNQNFAEFYPLRSEIKPQESELAIVNNLIRLLEAKTYTDHSLPIDYPRNLDLASVVTYINNVFSSLQGFEVDRVYLDRTEFLQKYNQLRQREEKQEISRMITNQAQRRLKQIEVLHENLRLQQMELARKQQQIKIQSRYQEELIRQQHVHEEQLRQQQHQEEIVRQQQMKQEELIRQQYLQRQIQYQRQIDSQRLHQQQQQQMQMKALQGNESSRGKMLRGTSSTYHETLYAAPQYINHPQPSPQIQIINKDTQPLPQVQIVNKDQQQPVFGQQTFGNSNQNSIGTLGVKVAAPQEKANKRQSMPMQNLSRPPLPPRSNENSSRPSQSMPSGYRPSSIQKQIEMVDSMILMQDEDLSDQNKKIIEESRIISYPV